MVAELQDLERFIRREHVPATSSVKVKSFETPSREFLLARLRASKKCTLEEAEAILATTPFTLSTGLTHGESQELIENLSYESVVAYTID